MKQILSLIICLGFSVGMAARPEPRAEDVLRAMHAANDYFIRKHPDPTTPTFVKKERPSNLWTRGVYYEGLMALNRIDLREANRDYVRRWAEFHRFMPRNGVYTRDADDYCCCQTYLEMYEQRADHLVDNGLADMIGPTLQCMDNLLHPAPEHMTPATKARYGDTSYQDWTWIDAIQMGLPVMTKLSKILSVGSQQADQGLEYAEHGYQMYKCTRDTLAGGLFKETNGLWWRDKDFVPPYREPNGANCYWSRGNGWVYAALVRAMSDALEHQQAFNLHKPARQFHYYDYEGDYLIMSRELIRYQRKDRFWNVSLADESNYGGKELTGTALFIYGFAWGIRHGLLNPEIYRPIVMDTWNAMVKYCLRKDGFLHYVQGTGKEPKDSQPVGRNIEPDFDDFGLGCFLLAGSEVYWLLNN